MVYRRKFPRRRRVFKRKRVYRKRRALSTFAKKKGYLKVIHHEIQMKVIPGGPMPSGVVDTETFDIQFLPNIAEYQRLFDMYRIKAVKLKFTPLTETSDTTNQSLLFVSSVDHDGSTTPTSFTEILQRTNAKVSPWAPGIGGLYPSKTITIVPRCRTVVAGTQDPSQPGVLVPAYAMTTKNQWLDLSDPSVPHHGLIYGWRSPNNSLNSAQTHSLDITYVVEFKGIR